MEHMVTRPVLTSQFANLLEVLQSAERWATQQTQHAFGSGRYRNAEHIEGFERPLAKARKVNW